MHALRPIVVGVGGAAACRQVESLQKRRQGRPVAGARRPALCEVPPPSDSIGHVEAKFMNMHKKGLVKVGEWYPVTLVPPFDMRLVFRSVRYYMNIIRPSVPVTVWNARDAEAQEGLSKSEFFERHGFVLLHRPTAMSASDWDASAPDPLGLQNLTGQGMRQSETPLSRVYWSEVEQIVRDLMPEAKELELDPLVVRRGPGTKNPAYNFAPHQDYGFTAEDWPLASPEFRDRFAQSQTLGLVVVNFWRPVRPMRGPVRKTPLAVCDPSSVKLEDVVPVSVRRDNAGYVKMLDLAYDPGQRWYYYPDMTVDEVLVFKSFQHFKGQGDERQLRTCFHTAFEHPTAPPDAEERQSCEYRARIWF